jgi:modulator of FtsH protease HflK
MAVLSESIHSFSDVATTLIVMIAIYRQQKKTRSGDSRPDSEDSEKKRNRIVRVYKKIRQVDTELKAAILISVLLISVSISLLFNTISGTPVKIENALTTGIIFIVLSVFSYFLYRFQISAAEEENSAALKADGLHTRADMLISMITGISLLVYYAGFDLDKYFGAAIALYIFTFSIRLLISSIRQASGYKAGFFDSLSGFKFIKNRHFIVGRKYFIKSFKILVLVSVGAVLVYYFSSSIFIVKSDEEALLFRFGRLVNKDGGIKPGIHLCFPMPVDDVLFVKTGKIFSLNIGNESLKKKARIWSNDHGDSVDYISGDNNFFLPYLSVHYRIKDPLKYYSAVQSDSFRTVLKNITDNVLNTIFSRSDFYDISIYKRKEIVQEANRLVQYELDNFDCGVEITGMFLKDLHPPTVIASSFEEVVASNQIKEKSLQDAFSYYNKKIPQARVDALKTLIEAQKYKTEKIKNASGESQAHSLKIDSFKKGKNMAKRIISLKTAEKTISGKKKILVDPSAGIDSDLLYYENYILKR